MKFIGTEYVIITYYGTKMVKSILYHLDRI